MDGVHSIFFFTFTTLGIKPTASVPGGKSPTPFILGPCVYIYIYTFILHFFDPCHHLSPHHITNAYLLQCHQLPEDFVRNFLFRHGLQRTFDMFQQEWYEQTSQDLVASSSEPTPDIYTINQSVRFMLRDYLHFRYPSPCLSSRTLLPPHFLGHDLDGRRASISTCTGRRLP